MRVFQSQGFCLSLHDKDHSLFGFIRGMLANALVVLL